MKTCFESVIALFLIVLFNQALADSEVPNNQRLVFQWSGKAISWELCFRDEVFFQSLSDRSELDISQFYSKDGSYRYSITALSSQGSESLYINKPASFISGCGGVKQGSRFYPVSAQEKVDIRNVSDVSQKIISENQKFIALFIPGSVWSRTENRVGEMLSIQPLSGNQRDWSWLLGDSNHRTRSLKQQDGQNDDFSFIHSKSLTPAVALGIAAGGVALGVIISAPCFCLLGWKCHKRVQKAGN